VKYRSIASHSKSEIDYVDQRAVSNNYFFDTSSEMASFLSTKFVDKVLYAISRKEMSRP